MIIIGIDPGKNGAFVMLDESGVLQKTVMPLIGKEFDLLAMTENFRNWYKSIVSVHLFIEDVHAIYGSSAAGTFSFGFVCGAIQSAAAAFGLPYTLVQPKAWQKVLYQGIPEIRKPDIIIQKGRLKGQSKKGNLDTKKMSELAAKRLFPTIDLRKNEACKISHDGIVDALLIAEYGRRNLK